MHLDPRLRQLLASWEERREAGECPTPEEHCPSDLIEPFKQILQQHAIFEPTRQVPVASIAPTKIGQQGPADNNRTVPTSTAEAAEGTVPYTPDALSSPVAANAPRFPGYEVIRELGQGGMGVVYEARDVNLKRLVAIKMIRGVVRSAHGLARFRAEAEAMASLKHPNTVQIHAWGECQGQPYFVLEHVPGGSLDKYLCGRPQPVWDTARFVLVLARAMHAAHECGLVHRDLKPANILLAQSRDAGHSTTHTLDPKIADFGLVKSLADGGCQTESGVLLGSPRYMAPEQAVGDAARVGPAADIYALGGILFEMLTGEPVFVGGERARLLKRVQNEPARSPRTLRPEVPVALTAICLKCLEKDPERRFPSMSALAAELQRFLDSTSCSNLDPSRRSPRRGRFALGLSVFALAVLLVVGFWRPWASRRNEVGGPPAAAAPLPAPKGWIDLRIWEPGNPKRQGLRLRDADALPLKAGDEIRIEARLDRPAYMYVIWIDTDGGATPVFPWTPGDWSKMSPHGDTRRDSLELPLTSTTTRWPLERGNSGVISLLLLATDEPWPPNAEVESLFHGLKKQSSDIFRAVWFENGKEVRDERERVAVRSKPGFDKEREPDDPIVQTQTILQSRLKDRIRFSRAVGFGFEDR